MRFDLILIMISAAFLITSCRDQEATMHNKWEAFLTTPTNSHYRAVAEQINKCHDASCRAAVIPDYEETAMLVKLIEAGDENSINLAFSIQSIIPPGHLLEEITRSLGSVADSNPRLFLEMAKDYQSSDEELEGMVNMMPEYVIDNLPEEKRAIQQRIESLLKIQDRKLIETRDRAIAFLKKHLQSTQDAELK